jgi:uncharacterized protein
VDRAATCGQQPAAGVFAFGTGIVLLTALELSGCRRPTAERLMIMVLTFVAPLELIAGIFAFLARDHGAATGLTMLSAAWAAVAITILAGPPGTPAPAGLVAHAPHRARTPKWGPGHTGPD